MFIIRRILSQGFVLETPEIPSGGGAPPAAVPEPVVTPPAGDAPWSADLAGLVPDESVRGQVDGYLREKWQPRVTKLEQDLAQYQPAHQLYDDFQSSPVDTTLAVVEQLFEGADLDAVKAALGITPPAVLTAPPVTPAQAAIDPRLAPALDAWEAQERERVWNEQMSPIREKDTHIKDEVFAPFVVGAGGNFDQAYSAYQAHQQQQAELLRAAGWTPPAEIVAPPAPATLGAGTGGTAAAPPPVEKHYGSVDEALDDFLADQRATRQAPATL